MIKYEDIITIIKKDDLLASYVEGVTKNVTLKEIGFDSLDVMMITSEIQEEFNTELEVSSDNTIEEIVKELNNLILQNKD